ncbi:MAG: holo-ACP synthase [Phycisphaerae bacterium]
MPTNIVSHGIDIVEVARIERIADQHGARFLDRVYTSAEQKYCLDNKVTGPRLAGRFAAKEAVLKVLGTGWRGGIEWTDIEVLPDALGKPLCSLTGNSRRLADQLGIADVLVSISHAGGFATASAIGIGTVAKDT